MVVPEWRIKRALASESLRAKLSHTRLKGIVREIDGAAGYKKKPILRKKIKNDPHFRQFVDELLKELGYMNE